MERGRNYNMARRIKDNILLCIIFIVASAACLLIESPSTCFLYPHFSGTDSSIFQYIGREWALNGRIPYRDAFDHKGPLLFLLNAVGVWLTRNRYGILIVQIGFLTFALLMAFKSCRLLYNRICSMGITALYLLVFSYFCSEGNLSEEYSLTFLLVGIYLVLKYYNSKQEEHNPLCAFVYGVCFGAMLMMRVNNAILLVGLCFGICVNLILHKKWKNLILNILGGCLGISAVVISFSTYFGLYGLEFEMWNASLLFNLEYSEDALRWSVNKDELFKIVEYSTVAVVTAVIAVVQWKKNRDTLSIGCILGIIASELMLWGGHRYKHYFMLYAALIPVLFYMLGVQKQTTKHVTYIISELLCILALLIIGMPVKKVAKDIVDAYNSIERNGEIKGSLVDGSYSIYDDIAGMIPYDERNRVAGYDVPAHFWLETDLSCCYEYFVFNDSHSNVENEIKSEMTELFLSGYAKWIVNQDEIDNEEILNYILQNYIVVYENNGIILYMKEGKRDVI